MYCRILFFTAVIYLQWHCKNSINQRFGNVLYFLLGLGWHDCKKTSTKLLFCQSRQQMKNNSRHSSENCCLGTCTDSHLSHSHSQLQSFSLSHSFFLSLMHTVSFFLSHTLPCTHARTHALKLTPQIFHHL